jgi:hypothetical protein
MRMNPLLRKWLVFTLTVLFLGTSITVLGESSDAIVTKMKATIGFHESSRDQTELRYYDPYTLVWSVRIQGNGLYIWKTAIRLTQAELEPYMDFWTLTKVNVAFTKDEGWTSMDIRIYIYDTGTSTQPGPLIANDTTYTLNTTGITTIPLVTPVSLSGHDELWIAVEWTQEPWYNQTPGGYALMDAGPAVHGKGDWIYLNNVWSETQNVLDGNWGIGAIINGTGMTQLIIGDIKGPLGIQADVQNIGLVNATNVSWSITATGGILGRVNASAIGTTASIVPDASTPISIGIFVGFGKISILMTAKAKNALEVTVTKSAFLLGPFVLGIR